MNHTLTSLLVIVLTALTFTTRSHAAAMGDNKAPVAIPIVESYPSNDAITLRWLKASDDNTPQEKLQYTVQWMKSNRTGAGSEVCTDIDCYTIKGLTPNARYSVQVSVSDESGLTFSYGTMTIATVAGAYDLAVGDVQVTTSNQDDVLGDGTVSFSMQDGQAILTLNNANINAAHYGIRAGNFDNGLTIKASGRNTITSDQEGIWVNGDCEITGNLTNVTGNAVGRAANKFGGNLTFCNGGRSVLISNKDDAIDMGGNMLSILSSSLEVKAVGSKGVAIANCGRLVTAGIDSYSTWHYDKDQRKFYTADGTEKTSIYIQAKAFGEMGYSIGGVEVTTRNYYDVFGDRGGNWPEGSVSVYGGTQSGELNIYLRNANIENANGKPGLEIGLASIRKVTIFLEGRNTINSSVNGIYVNHELHIKGPGSLSIFAGDYALWNYKSTYLEDHCDVELYGDEYPFLTDSNSSFQIKESSLTLHKGRAFANDPVIPICPAFSFMGSYIASGQTYQYKNGRTNFYNSDGNVEYKNPIIIKAGSGPEPTNRYDVNDDGQVNSADVVSIYNYIIDGEQSGISTSKADVNQDGSINAADVVAIYNYIIEGE